MKSGIITKAVLALAVLIGPMVALADERDADAKDVNQRDDRLRA